MEDSVNEQVEPVIADDLDDQLRACVSFFEESEDSTRESRRLSERDRDYYDSDQWTSEELAILRKRRQPALTINYIKRKVEFLRGFERRMRSDPKAFPRTPKEEQLAEAATDALRYLADLNDFDEVRSRVYENFLVEGAGGADVYAEENAAGEIQIRLQYVPWDRLFWDPHSVEYDFSDAKYKGVVIWMDTDDARRKYPEREDAIENTVSSVSKSETYDDRPKRYLWCDSKRKRIRVVQIHYQWGGEWMIATFTKGGFLIDPQVSPYVDKEGASCSSLILRSMYINRENQRYGDVRSMISLQDEINKRRSKALHLLSVRQTYGTKESLTDTTKAKGELAKPDGHVEMNPGAKFGTDFGVIPTGDLAQGQIALMQQAVQEMQASGPNVALAGKETQNQSGRALQAKQQGGAVEIEPGLDQLRMWTRDMYEAAWMRVRQFWTDEKWVRVTDDERNLKWVGLNQQVTLGEALKEIPPEQAQQYAQSIGLMQNDPRLQQVVEVRNNVSGLDVDISVEDGPDITSLQSEQFEMLSQLAMAMPGAIPPKAIIAASTLRNKDQLLEEMDKAEQQAMQAQQGQQQVAQQRAQVEDGKTQAQTAKDAASAERTQVETAIMVRNAQQPTMLM